MPSRWEIRLGGDADVAVPVEAPHAVLSRWLDGDHRAPVKPYALCPPRMAGADVVILEVRLLEDGLGHRLRASAPTGTKVRLGRHHFRVLAEPRSVAWAPWSAYTEWMGARAWTVRFVSPATFRRGDRSSPWPAPQSVVTSLANRWRALRPDTTPATSWQTHASLWVSDIEGHSEAVLINGRIVSGFVGSVRYVCDGLDSEAAAVDALLRFATHAGIGAHTAFGFGMVELDQSDRRARRADGSAAGPAELAAQPSP
jgi:CRISPR-associated endoribonuclease Cas6